ncbi:hypothetical protein [Algivirga pacifica]|uniref:DUF4365 domain-containing protein n=1 Tax=Algivirga pacifica TaxID=1162670 RepID=A0ABP9DNZ0_9BACT
MKVTYKEYLIEVLNEYDYSVHSTDNINSYQLEYSKGAIVQERIHPISKHGIRVKDLALEHELSSAILCEFKGATSVHKKSFYIDHDKIWICVCNAIYCLGIPNLKLIWYGQYDPATNISLLPFMDDFIIHGELEIIRINRDGEIQWKFDAPDIFITESGTENFRIHEKTIEVEDWQNTAYTIDENGIGVITMEPRFHLEVQQNKIIQWIEEWLRLLEKGSFNRAFNTILHDPYYQWTPQLMENVISNYGFPEDTIGKYRIEFPQGEDSSYAQINFWWDSSSQKKVAIIEYEVPLNGTWSDLTISFEVKENRNVFEITLNDIHVM